MGLSLRRLAAGALRAIRPRPTRKRLKASFDRYLREEAAAQLGRPLDSAVSAVEGGKNTLVRRWADGELGTLYARAWPFDLAHAPARSHLEGATALAAAGLRVPAQVLLDDSLATGWRHGLEAAIEGAAPGEPLDLGRHARTGAIESLARDYARMHSLRGRRWGRPWSPADDRANPAAFWRRRAAQWRRWWPSGLAAPPDGEAILRELETAMPAAPSLLHGDFSLRNLFIDSTGRLAWIDFGTVQYGEPALDLAGVWWTLDPSGLWETFLAAYVGSPEHPPAVDVSRLRLFRRIHAIEKIHDRARRLDKHAGGDASQVEELLRRLTAIG